MPVDPEPVHILLNPCGDTLIVTKAGTAKRGNRVKVHSQAWVGAETGYISHFATCPHAKKHRKVKKS